MSAFDFDFEIYDLKHEDYKDLLYEEVQLYHDDNDLKSYLENKKKDPEGVLHKRFALNKIKSKREPNANKDGVSK